MHDLQPASFLQRQNLKSSFRIKKQANRTLTKVSPYLRLMRRILYGVLASNNILLHAPYNNTVYRPPASPGSTNLPLT